MEILFLFGYFIMFILIFILIKSRVSRVPIALYVLWWGILLGISITDPYDLYPVSLSTYSLLFLNSFMFFIGYIVISDKKNNIKLKPNLCFKRFNKINLVTQLLIFPILIFYAIKYQILLNSYGHTYARIIRYDLGLLFNTVYESALYSYILQPIVLISSILVAIKIVNRDIKNFTFFIMLINVILNSSIGLGRFGYFQLMIFIIMIYLLIKKKSGRFIINIRKIGQQFILLILGIILITLMNYTMLIRRGKQKIDMESVIEGYHLLFDQAITYFVGPFRAIDYFLNNYIRDEYYYGKLTIGGLEHIFGIFFKILDGDYSIAYQIISPTVQEPIIIGYGKTFNAFYTNLLNHYLDFDIVGIIIFPLIYGMIVSYFANEFTKHQNVASLSILVYVSYNALITNLNWTYENLSAWVTLILLFSLNVFWCSNERKKGLTLNKARS